MSFSDDIIGAADRAIMGVWGGPAAYRTEDNIVISRDDWIFSNSYLAVNAGEADIPSTKPNLFIRLEDLPVDPREEHGTVTHNGTEYRVVNVEEDDAGAALLILQKIETA